VEFPYFRPHGVQRQIDWWGVFTLTSCLVPLLLALTWVTNYGWVSQRVVGLLIASAVMLAAFLLAESRAEEPLLPLWLFRDRTIAVSSIVVFLLGIGMFGVILYVPLFMQGVLGISATRSGSLLTPLLIGAVLSSVAAGNIISRTGRYRTLAIFGSALATVGMFLMAAMNASTTKWDVVRNMIIVGLGLGIMQPIYTLVVQNVAPPAHMGAATASTQFFRSIGATVGVAVFGSILLTRYHDRFESSIPPGTPQIALQPFKEPLMLMQIRTRLEAVYSLQPHGADLLHKLLDNVRVALLDGLHYIFLAGAILMVVAAGANLLLRDIPLRKKAHGHAVEA
jgi:MFS family permease